jgi:hypothetical protein
MAQDILSQTWGGAAPGCGAGMRGVDAAREGAARGWAAQGWAGGAEKRRQCAGGLSAGRRGI